MDSLCFKAGIHGPSSTFSVGGDLCGRKHPAQVSALGRSGAGVSNWVSMENSTPSSSMSRFSFTFPLKSLWPGGRKGNNGIALDDAVSVMEDGEQGEEIALEGGGENDSKGSEEQRGNWVLKILQVRSLWKEQEKNSVDELEQKKEKDDDMVNGRCIGCPCCDEEESEVCRVEEEEEVVGFDQESFSRLLQRVSLAEAKLYAQMSYLGNLAYSVPKIKAGNLLRQRGLHFVTSSVEKKKELINAEKEQASSKVQAPEKDSTGAMEGKEQRKKNGYQISASAAYQISAAAASYLHYHSRSILPFKSSKAEGNEDLLKGGTGTNDNVKITSSELASLVATTNSVTAVVAAKEEIKQAVARDLNSAHSSPCEWFICDDDQIGTRFFVIQGSDSLASWQANLLFEPIQFEGLDVVVHRGVYEAAKGIYEQMLPEGHAHLKSRGNSATLRFTGHSLGGSLSLLINLMLLIRGEVPPSALLPVVTFGAPSIMCGGDQLLHKLGLPRSHVQAITMHRDIVPRAFSCNYPDHVADLLKAVNANFRSHPCLKNQSLLYAPMGELMILQPDEKFSPHHHLLPSGSGLYLLSCPASDSADAEKQLRAAQTVFFNSPHPLEILSDRSAYGSDGTINRDHDINSYLRSVRGVIRQELNHIRKAKREHRRRMWWPLVAPHVIYSGITGGRSVESSNIDQQKISFSGVLRTGRKSLKRFSKLAASEHMHLLVVLLFHAKLLLVGAYAVIGHQLTLNIQCWPASCVLLVSTIVLVGLYRWKHLTGRWMGNSLFIGFISTYVLCF
ncbi:hypothetical protein HHK36_020857 [Tetracentron sinense]|uniref:Fungal lipase-type domain-containing protein n=1 Tax=Tetracentron sinense TaxID=13715 RepID=A0A834YZP0_TETSI|nr:hypothetical protein HHK36_020857 [Tetracentron sinense]